jgi:GT2 family glycosyltransferase
MSKAALIILNWNGLQYLQKFLGTVVSLSSFPGSVVCVADNGSIDDSVKWVKNNYPSVKVIELGKNHGFAGGYNIALEQIEAEYFILINSDIEVTSGWAEKLVRFMDDHPEAAACQPKILSWHNRHYFEYAGAAGGYIDKFGYPFCRGRVFDKIEKDEGQYDNICEIFWTSGACMIIRANAWKRCKGFDPSFFAHMEEIDLCWRLLLDGYKLYFFPDSVVYHVGGGALPYNSPFKTYLNFRNNLFLLHKNLPGKILHKTLFIRKMLDGISAIYFLKKGDFRNIRAIWKAHMDYYKSYDEMKLKRKETERISEENPWNYILNKSLVFEFYVKGNKTFKKLETIF